MKEEKFKSTKLLEEAIREHRADYPRGVDRYKDGVYYGLTLALQLLTSDSQVPAAKVEPYYKCMLENDPKYNPVLPLKGLPQRSLVYLKFVFEDYQEGDSEDEKWCYRRAFPQMGGNSDSVDFVVDTGETLRFLNEDYEKTWFAYNRNPEGQYE